MMNKENLGQSCATGGCGTKMKMMMALAAMVGIAGLIGHFAIHAF